MLLIIALVIASLFVYFLKDKLKQYPNIFYIGAAVVTIVIFSLRTLFPFRIKHIENAAVHTSTAHTDTATLTFFIKMLSASGFFVSTHLRIRIAAYPANTILYTSTFTAYMCSPMRAYGILISIICTYKSP
mgnify:CR=1 FL=1